MNYIYYSNYLQHDLNLNPFKTKITVGESKKEREELVRNIEQRENAIRQKKRATTTCQSSSGSSKRS